MLKWMKAPCGHEEKVSSVERDHLIAKGWEVIPYSDSKKFRTQEAIKQSHLTQGKIFFA